MTEKLPTEPVTIQEEITANYAEALNKMATKIFTYRHIISESDSLPVIQAMLDFLNKEFPNYEWRYIPGQHKFSHVLKK